MGLVNPNSLIDAMICSTCRLGWVRAFRGSGTRASVGRYSTANGREAVGASNESLCMAEQ